MKNAGSLSVFVCLAVLSYAQNGTETRQVTTQTNGVVVHESAGNEGFVVTTASEVKIRTIDDWTLPECIDALRALSEKSALLGSSEEDAAERQRYADQQLMIEKRRDTLMQHGRP